MAQELEKLGELIRNVLAHYPAVEAGYLFGSTALGEAGPRSDVDLALVGPAEELRLDILADLTAAGLDRVDLVFLDEADTVLRFEALRPNCLIYRRPDFDHGSYFSRGIREYFDLEPYLRIQREALKRRLHGQA
jgi:predicted nucleotidyltransferase